MFKTKRNWLHRSMALFLSVIMILSLVPTTAFAAETDESSACSGKQHWNSSSVMKEHHYQDTYMYIR